MKTTKEKRERERLKKEKLSIRVIGKTPDKKKKGATWEFELFKKIAMDRCLTTWSMLYVFANHITPGWKIEKKTIFIEDLTPTNFSHIKPKGMYPELRLKPSNIEIVSRAYHEWQHTKQIPQTNYIN